MMRRQPFSTLRHEQINHLTVKLDQHAVSLTVCELTTIRSELDKERIKLDKLQEAGETIWCILHSKKNSREAALIELHDALNHPKKYLKYRPSHTTSPALFRSSSHPEANGFSDPREILTFYQDILTLQTTLLHHLSRVNQLIEEKSPGTSLAPDTTARQPSHCAIM